ncbi:MAG: hypothetical protein ACT4N2_02045 [Hyphomicrobium sp.]
MTTQSELRTGLLSVAKRSVAIMGACTNEESTKLYLVLPVLGLLGYDYTNPYEVYPEHAAGFASDDVRKVDLTILRDGEPTIAIECKKVGADLTADRGQLCGYFNALVSVKVGVITNGILFEFFVDSDEPNMMDEDPFLTLDMETIARVGVPQDVLDALFMLTKDQFEGELIAETAHVQLMKKRLRTIFVDEAKSPSEEFCRMALEKAGLRNVRKTAIERYYAPMVKTAFEESLVLPVVQQLRSDPAVANKTNALPLHQIGQRISTSERELAIFKYIKRRLSYLVDDEHHFDAVEELRYRDYVGKLVVYFDRERKGRLFDFIEGADGYDKFVFPDPIGEIVTNTLTDIDSALKVTFVSRVRELGGHGAALMAPKLARSA